MTVRVGQIWAVGARCGLVQRIGNGFMCACLADEVNACSADEVKACFRRQNRPKMLSRGLFFEGRRQKGQDLSSRLITVCRADSDLDQNALRPCPTDAVSRSSLAVFECFTILYWIDFDDGQATVFPSEAEGVSAPRTIARPVWMPSRGPSIMPTRRRSGRVISTVAVERGTILSNHHPVSPQ